MKSKIKDRWNSMSARNKILTIMLFSLFLIGTGSAYWVISHNATSGLIISSDVDLTFTNNFNASSEINTDLSAFSKVEVITIDNNNGEINLSVGLNKTIIDVVDSCDNTDDTSWIVEYDGVELTDLDTITIPSGETNLTLTTNVVKFACPTTATIEIDLNQII